MRPHPTAPKAPRTQPSKKSNVIRRTTWIIIGLVIAGLVYLLFALPPIPEIISDDEFRAKYHIFEFSKDAADVTPKPPAAPHQSDCSTKESRPQLSQSRSPAVSGDPSTGKGKRHRGEEARMGIRGTGRGGGGPGEGTIGHGQLNTIGYGGGGGIGAGYGRGAGGLGGVRAPSYSRSGLLALQAAAPPFNTEDYAHLPENAFLDVAESPLSTFAIDVDTAAYANMRRFLTQGKMPPLDAVRIEEMINYFTYDYPQPTDDAPFATHVETARCPWNRRHLLTRIGLKAKEIAPSQRPAANLVFLIDVSGSMWSPNKLLLLKQSMAMMVHQLHPEDRVAMVVYAGQSGVVLQSTLAANKRAILDAIYQLEAGGSTNGASGISAAYQLAAQHFVQNGINRVILATDGDFNVGVTSHGALTRLIENKRKSGVYLSVLGFGMGNYKDRTLEQLADKGNGNYAYIDTLKEAKKVLVKQLGQTLMTVAADVKIQVEFNPEKIRSYRLIGYENRLLAARDFNDDTKDAGEIGAGHTVTAMYELIPVTADTTGTQVALVDPLKYQTTGKTNRSADADELYTLKLRYKTPGEKRSQRLIFPIAATVSALENATADFRFAASVAGVGMLLRHAKATKNTTLNAMKQLAQQSVGADGNGYRKEFITLISKATQLTRLPRVGLK